MGQVRGRSGWPGGKTDEGRECGCVGEARVTGRLVAKEARKCVM